MTNESIYETKQALVHEILKTRRERNMTQKNIDGTWLDRPAADHHFKSISPLGKNIGHCTSGC